MTKTNEWQMIEEILSHPSLHQQNAKIPKITLPAHIGEGTLERIQICPALEIVLSDMILQQDSITNFIDDSEMFEMNYYLSGDSICSVNNEPFRMDEPKHHVSYFHHSNVQLKMRAHTHIQKVEIRMTPQKLLQYFKNAEDKASITQFLQQQRGQITAYDLSTSVKQRVYEILHCPYQNDLQKIYLEAKIMELIVYFFSPIIQPQQKEQTTVLHTNDIAKLQRVKELILQSLEQPPNIAELAEAVALSESKLKTSFRQRFGTTVYSYIKKQRMERAAWLMEFEDMNVTEAASHLGYSNMSNFTVAFRQHFGCNPSEFLKK